MKSVRWDQWVVRTGHGCSIRRGDVVGGLKASAYCPAVGLIGSL